MYPKIRRRQYDAIKCLYYKYYESRQQVRKAAETHLQQAQVAYLLNGFGAFSLGTVMVTVMDGKINNTVTCDPNLNGRKASSSHSAVWTIPVGWHIYI